MDILELQRLQKNLKSGESLVIDSNGEVRIIKSPSNKKGIVGKLETFPNETISGLKNKLWATPPTPGKQKYWKFGEELPKWDNNSLLVKSLIGLVLTFKSSAKKYKWTDTTYKFTYDVIEVQDIKVYFYQGNPRFIESDECKNPENGNRIYIVEKFPELKLEKFKNIDDVK